MRQCVTVRLKATMPNATRALGILALAAALTSCGGKTSSSSPGTGGSGTGGAGTTGSAGNAGTTGAGGTSGGAGIAGTGGGGAAGGAGTLGAGGVTGTAGGGGGAATGGRGGASGSAGATGGAGASAGRGGSSGGRGGSAGSASPDGGTGLGSWELLAPMPGGARQEFNVAALKGLVYAIGAFGTAADSRRLEAYDPATNTWTTKASIPFASDHPNVAATADKIYILGEVGNTNSAEYDPVTNTWTMKAPIPTQRAASSTAAIGTKIYVAGGAMGSNGASFGPTVRDFAVYDTVTNTWETLDPMPAPGRNHAPGVAANGIFYVIGGRTNGPMDALQKRGDAYDPVAKTWTSNAPMPVERGRGMGGRGKGP